MTRKLSAPDTEWLKCLLNSSFEQGRWQGLDPEALNQRARGHLAEAIPLLYQWLEESIGILNLHRKSSAPRFNLLKLNPLETEGEEDQSGLVLLCGSTQLRVVLKTQYVLEASISQVRSYQRFSQKTHEFSPYFDSFGALYWRSDGQMIMGLEKVGRTLLEDLCKHANQP